MSKTEVYIKINTIPIEEYAFDSKALERFAETYAEPKQLDSIDEIRDEWNLSAGKSPIFGKIESITMAYVEDETIKSVVIRGEEKDVINKVYQLLNSPNFKYAKLLSWNFDFMTGFFSLRPLVSGVDLSTTPKQIKDSFNKPWSRKLSQDIFDLVNPGWSKNSFINTLFALGLEYEKILTGEELTKAHLNNNTQELFDSHIQFIHGMVNIHRRLNNQDVIYDITSTELEVEPNLKVAKVPLLERLYSNNELSEDIKQEIQTLTSKVKLTKKDKSNLETILFNIYVRDDFENNDQDSKAVKESKYQEVKEFVKTL